VNLPPRVAEWKASGQFIELSGHRLFYRDSRGGNDVIVCLHGFPTSSFDWLPVWAALSENHRLIAHDLLGFGLSDKPTGHDYTIAEQTDLLLALLKTLGVERAHLLSHDYGSILAQELMARAGAGQAVGALHIDSVTFLNGALFPEMHRPRLAQSLLLSPLGWLVARLFNEKKFGRSFSAIFAADTRPTEKEIKEFWSLIEVNEGARVMHRLINYIRERRQFRDRWVNGMIDSPIPTLLVNGLDDPVSGAHLLTHARQHMSRASFVELPGIGHYPQVEAPEQVIDAFLDFVMAIRSKPML